MTSTAHASCLFFQAKRVRWRTAQESHNANVQRRAVLRWATWMVQKSRAQLVISRWRQKHMWHAFRSWQNRMSSTKSKHAQVLKVIMSIQIPCMLIE